MKLPYHRTRFAQMVLRCCADLRWTRTGDLPRHTNINKGTLHGALAEPPEGKRRRRLTDKERRKVVNTLMDAMEQAGLQGRGAISRREFLAVAGFLTLPTAVSESPPPRGWEDWLREGLAFSDRGNADEAFRLFELVERLGADIPGVTALALAHQALAAMGRNRDASVIKELITRGLDQLHAPLLPHPEAEPSEKKIAQFLPTQPERRAFAQLAVARAHHSQERQRYAEALSACNTIETVAGIMEDTRLVAALLAEMHRICGDTKIQMGTKRAAIDAPAASRRVIKSFPLWQAVDHFADAGENRPWDDEVGRGFALRGQGKALHLLEHSEEDRRKRARISAHRVDAEQELESWIAKNPGCLGVVTIWTLDQGRREADRGHDQEAFDAFQAALELAWQVRSRYIFVESHARLAEILERGRAPDHLVLDHRAAALALWPEGMYGEDFQRVRVRLQRLNPDLADIQRAWARSNSPTALLRGMPEFDEHEALRRVHMELQASSSAL